MKQYLLPIALIVSAFAQAQITFQSSNLPVVGTVWEIQEASNTSSITITPGSATSQTWNYANTGSTSPSTIIEFIPKAAVPYSSQFVNATMGSIDGGDTSSNFYYTDTNGFYLDGFALDTGSGAIIYNYAPDEILIPANITLNGSRSASPRFEYSINFGPVSVQTINRRNQSFLADAFGTLTTPEGTFTNVLRIKQTVLEYDTIITNFTSLPPVVDVTTSGYVIYHFVRNNNVSPILMEVLMDSLGTTVDEAYYYLPNPVTSLKESVTAAESLSVYPNPAHESIQIARAFPGVDDLRIFDGSGKMVYSGKLVSLQETVSLKSFSEGNYFYVISGRNGVKSGKFVKQ